MGAPILEFKVEDLLDDEKFERFREVLKFWVLTDHHNVRLYKMGMRSVNIPGEYTTNGIPQARNARYFLSYAPPGIRAQAEETADELLEWLAAIRFNDSDFLGTLLANLALRHHDPEAQTLGADLFMRLRNSTRLDTAMGTSPDDAGDYVFAPYDKLLAELQERVSPADDDGDS